MALLSASLAGCPDHTLHPPDLCAGVSCAAEEACVDGRCLATHCGGRACGPNRVCANGACVDAACLGVSCVESERCRSGACAPILCSRDTDCYPTERCVGGRCAFDSCIGVACPEGRVCRVGKGCVLVACSDDAQCLADEERCDALGRCAPRGGCDDVVCSEKKVCRDGVCRTISCRSGAECGPGEVCRAGACLWSTDPCAQVSSCPSGQVCRRGECLQVACGASQPCLGNEACTDGFCSPPLMLEQAEVSSGAAIFTAPNPDAGSGRVGFAGGQTESDSHALRIGVQP
ncbi:MAG: hypothetical protein IRZ16_17940 [Myxococcaceae bacterium]|nr:hypothetical protein [Myxococcaceae bacterium]